MEPFNIEAEIVSSLRDMSDEDLRSFAELQEDPTSDEQIELYIYTCFFIYMRTHSTECLEQAIQRTEGWIEVAASDHPDRARRFQILDMMSARMTQHGPLLEDIPSTHLETGPLAEGASNDCNDLTLPGRSGSQEDATTGITYEKQLDTALREIRIG